MFRTCFYFEKEDIVKVRVALRVSETVITAQRVPIPGDEALCITLRWLAYPNRLKDLENVFGRHRSTISSLTIEVLSTLMRSFSTCCLTIDMLENFSKAIYAKGAPLTNCWGFNDGTARSKHDAGNFGDRQVYTKLEKLVQGHHYCFYGDPAYP
ncbi:hypothetical protein MRX96_051519 [Rhipicephalus microplus]